MKAAVMYQQGEMPQYADVPEPVVKSDEELIISVKAAAIIALVNNSKISIL